MKSGGDNTYAFDFLVLLKKNFEKEDNPRPLHPSQVPGLELRSDNPRFDSSWLYLQMVVFLCPYLVNGITRIFSNFISRMKTRDI